MRKWIILEVIASFLLVNTVFSQTDTNKAHLFLSSGYGYYNNGNVLDGQAVWTEFGLKMKNDYVFIAQASLAENINTIGSWPALEDLKFDRIGTHKLFTIFIGYEFQTRNKRNTITPMVGPFICMQNTSTPNYDDQNFYGTLLIKKYYMGFSPGLRYTFNCKNGISLGLTSSINFAVDYGLISYSVSPLVSFRLQ